MGGGTPVNVSRALLWLRRLLAFMGFTDAAAGLTALLWLDGVVWISGIPEPASTLFPQTMGLLLVSFGAVQMLAARDPLRLPQAIGVVVLTRFAYFGLTLYHAATGSPDRFFLVFGLTDLLYNAATLSLAAGSPELGWRRIFTGRA